ncbi:glycosyl hydrolase [Kiritimatiellota bacterium B12222]|nr:glycosyl hydrolase [Kiritimatiellota bacterium B12222]
MLKRISLMMVCCAWVPLMAQPTVSSMKVAVEELRGYIAWVAAEGYILSGQHITGSRLSLAEPRNEFTHVQNLTGEAPAILGMDLWVPQSAQVTEEVRRRATVAMAIEQWRQGGLVTISWHHEYPGVEKGLWENVQTERSQADFDLMLTPGTEEYAIWLAEVDGIALYLQKLQEAGVPVIFRPYHEMDGGWFWWGAKEPESFHRLWRNLYRRLVDHHGLENLLWSWSPNQNAQMVYYPGDTWVDFTGVDAYLPTRNEAVILSDEKKLEEVSVQPFALTEVGLLPAIEQLAETRYAWFLVWHTGWCDNEFYGMPGNNGPGNSPEVLKEIYAWEKALHRGDVDLQAPKK